MFINSFNEEMESLEESEMSEESSEKKQRKIQGNGKTSVHTTHRKLA